MSSYSPPPAAAADNSTMPSAVPKSQPSSASPDNSRWNSHGVSGTNRPNATLNPSYAVGWGAFPTNCMIESTVGAGPSHSTSSVGTIGSGGARSASANEAAAANDTKSRSIDSISSDLARLQMQVMKIV